MKKENELNKEFRDRIIHHMAEAAGMGRLQADGKLKVNAPEFQNEVDELCDYIARHTFRRPKTLKEKLLFWFKSWYIGIIVHLPHYAWSALFLYIGFSMFHPISYINALGIFIILRTVAVNCIHQKPTEIINKKNHEKDPRS